MVTRVLSLSLLMLVLSGCFLVPGHCTPTSPPPVLLDSGSQRLEVHPYTTCWTAGSAAYCADGVPPDPLPDLGRVTGPVSVTFPVDGWDLVASASLVGTGHRTSIDLVLVEVSEHTWSMRTDLPGGTYEVFLSGRGPQGDIAAAFQLTVVGA